MSVNYLLSITSDVLYSSTKTGVPWACFCRCLGRLQLKTSKSTVTCITFSRTTCHQLRAQLLLSVGYNSLFLITNYHESLAKKSAPTTRILIGEYAAESPLEHLAFLRLLTELVNEHSTDKKYSIAIGVDVMRACVKDIKAGLQAQGSVSDDAIDAATVKEALSACSALIDCCQ